MDEYYETKMLSFYKAKSFIEEFERKVGTEFEITHGDNHRQQILCFELEPNEIKICREIERKL